MKIVKKLRNVTSIIFVYFCIHSCNNNNTDKNYIPKEEEKNTSHTNHPTHVRGYLDAYYDCDLYIVIKQLHPWERSFSFYDIICYNEEKFTKEDISRQITELVDFYQKADAVHPKEFLGVYLSLRVDGKDYPGVSLSFREIVDFHKLYKRSFLYDMKPMRLETIDEIMKDQIKVRDGNLEGVSPGSNLTW